jgi:hypothetical protein
MKSSKRFVGVFQNSLVVLLVLVGCQNTSSIEPTGTKVYSLSTSIQTPLSTIKAPPISTLASPIKTATTTLSPTKTTPPTIIWMPAPTLSPEMAELKVQSLLATNGDCKFPCWWGISPGKTTKVDAIQFLYTFTDIQTIWGVPGDYHDIHIQPGDAVDDITSSYFIYGDYGSFTITFQNNVVDMISAYHGGGTGAQRVSRYQLSRVFEDNGMPEEIWLAAAFHSPVGNIADLLLFYKIKGIFIHYNYSNLSISNGNLQICPQGIGPEELDLWPPSMHDYSSLAKYYFHQPISWPTLEIATGMDGKDFFERYKNISNNACFDTPISLWEYKPPTPTP